jgi:hypothetical protein
MQPGENIKGNSMKKRDYTYIRSVLKRTDITENVVRDLTRIQHCEIRELRKLWGLPRSPTFKCNTCGLDKAPNCFKSENMGMCIICRRQIGIEVNNVKGGRPSLDITVQTVRVKCLKCDPVRWFLSPVGYDGRAVYHICPSHRKTNNYLGDEECATLNLRFG